MSHSLHSRLLRPTRWVGVGLLLAAVLFPAPLRARDSQPAELASPMVGAPNLTSSVLLADDSDWSWSKVTKPFQVVQGSRRTMVQFATIGMCIALYIIWWRKVV
jgi:hypothetical protein